ncbi:hypothetical protein NQZ68_006198 [Dissostichus eleginoides]|nr:hypothetical protein NQZ68_006198 [Dissostichus eleginoides]
MEKIVKTRGGDAASTFFVEQVDTHGGLKVEVWDKDLNFDDHLRSCVVYLSQGTHRHSCPAKKGGFEFQYTLTCDPHLTGDRCNRYKPSPK